MNIKIYIYLLVFVLLFLACKTTIVDNEKYKDSDAVFLSMTKEYTLNHDGSQEYIYRQRLKLQTHVSFNSKYGDSHIYYDPSFQNCKILLAETENSMGKSIVGDNAINDILPSNAKCSAYYNRLREKVVSHMGTEIGAVINFDYKLESKKENRPALFDIIEIPSSSPIIDFKIVIRIPKDKNLKFHLFNSLVKPTVEQKSNEKFYTWKFKDIEAKISQGGEPLIREDLAYLIFTTATKDDVKSLISESKLIESDANFFVPIVESIRTKLKDKEALFLKLQETVVDNIAFNDIKFKDASYRGRSARQIWQDASANLIEKSFLLKELLSNAGYSSEVLVVSPCFLFEHASLNPNLWTDCYVSINDGDKSYLLRADRKNTYDSSCDLDGLRLLNPLTGKEVIFSSSENIVNLEGVVNIFSRKHIWSRLKLELSGKPKNVFMKNDYYKSKLDYCSKIYTNKEASYNCIIIDSLTGKNLMGKYFKYKLPIYKDGFNIKDLPILLADRKTPLEIGNTIYETYKYKINLGKSYYTINKDTIIEEENAVGKVHFSINAIADTTSIINYQRYLSLKKKIINPSEYKDFKRLMDIWNDENYKEIIFSFKKVVSPRQSFFRDTTKIIIGKKIFYGDLTIVLRDSSLIEKLSL